MAARIISSLTRPSLAASLPTYDGLTWRANEILGALAAGNLTLRDTGDAHRVLEARKTTRQVLLVP